MLTGNGQLGRIVATEAFADASLATLVGLVNAWLLAAGENRVLDVQYRATAAGYFAWVVYTVE